MDEKVNKNIVNVMNEKMNKKMITNNLQFVRGQEQENLKVIQSLLLDSILPGFNFTNILHEAFAPIDLLLF